MRRYYPILFALSLSQPAYVMQFQYALAAGGWA